VRLEALFTDVLVVLNHIYKTIINLLRKAFFTGHVLVRSFRLERDILEVGEKGIEEVR
jgi:hypothetical protein